VLGVLAHGEQHGVPERALAHTLAGPSALLHGSDQVA
jgi:hypothetical protein